MNYKKRKNNWEFGNVTPSKTLLNNLINLLLFQFVLICVTYDFFFFLPS